MTDSRPEAVYSYLQSLQKGLCAALEKEERGHGFIADAWERPPATDALSGRGLTATLEGGAILERAGVALSDVSGTRLPPAATARNPNLSGTPFRAMGVSVVIHPRSPLVPTAHLNVRCFTAGEIWWFGGGFDLTPYLPIEDDIRQWHQAAAQACEPFHAQLYPRLRAHCDEYFYLHHRGEARGVGGIFFDDLNADTEIFGMPWERCFEFLQSVGTHFQQAYLALLQRRRHGVTGDRERRYQLYRRGRYAEFNLLQDRGTLFGLQSGGRTDAILMSMPPLAQWAYRSPDPELDAKLLPYLTTLRGRDWLASP